MARSCLKNCNSKIPAIRDTQLFNVLVEGALGMAWEEFEAPMDLIHKKGGEYVAVSYTHLTLPTKRIV